MIKSLQINIIYHFTLLSNITHSISNDLILVDNVIKKSLFSEIPIVNQISNHIINSGGKRIRPSLLLLLAKLSGEIKPSHHEIAAIIEFIHTATLLHDDVVDQSTQRRSSKTANVIFGNSASVLVGDFIYSRSFQMMSKINNLEVMRILADTTNSISEGEIYQLLNTNNAEVNEDDYFQVIDCKTAKLFEACGSLAGTLNNSGRESVSDLALLARNFGVIFQLTDDILDYSGKEVEMGKNIGDDLAEGKMTLPLIYAMKAADSSEQKIIKDAIKVGDINHLPQIIDILKKTNSIKKVSEKLNTFVDEINLILDKFNSSETRDELRELASYIAQRKN